MVVVVISKVVEELVDVGADCADVLQLAQTSIRAPIAMIGPDERNLRLLMKQASHGCRQEPGGVFESK